MGCPSFFAGSRWKRRRSSSSHEEIKTRTIYVGHRPAPGSDLASTEKFPNNKVVTAKYTIWNFLPKNLFEQFRRIANFYFLCIAVIQLSISSPVSPATSLTPLIFVVTVTAIKQAYEDWLRHQADQMANKLRVRIADGEKLKRIVSQDIKVGDVVLVKSEEEFPCDLVLLSSSDSEGHCHITTANLDGETNLKVHECLPQTRSYRNTEVLTKLIASIECENPSPDLYKFVGRMKIYEEGQQPVICSLGPKNMVLKGARLKNTSEIYGCAVYTGQETKMALNLRLTSNKFSTVEKSMNRFLIAFLILLVVETSVCTSLKHYYRKHPVLGVPWYIPSEGPPTSRRIFADFLAFVVLFNYIIPISLYVTLEMVKFVGAMFFTWDAQLYDEATSQGPKCNTSDLNEELGQVEYLFTDKTGTLTENDMKFRHCSINGQRFTEANGMLCCVQDNIRLLPEPVGALTPEIEQFLQALVLCNTVQVNPKSMGPMCWNGIIVDSSTLEYQASSPDEKALVEACRRFGYVLHGLHENYYRISYRGKIRQFQQLHVLEFDSYRRRMSVVVRDEEGQVFLVCKGADSALLDRVITGPKGITEHHVNDYALEGLRTLVVAQKVMTQDEYLAFNHQLQEARSQLEDRDEKVSQVFDMVEQDLHLLGATAIEDRLQDGVCETLECLRVAGIKVWVLTGDKHETAINVSYSCGHLKRGMTLLNLLNQQSSRECKRTLHILKGRIDEEQYDNYALVADGHSLTFGLSSCRELLYEVCHRCQAVLCCRMSPIQKAKVVTLIKCSPDRPITAAIGDGANDVSMIQEAHVGLGIMGKEGRQAVRCSDFAFAKFHFLKQVLLVHGHYYYVRASTLVQYFFYKNIAFILPQVYYTFFSAFSAQTLYHSFYLMLYNIFFTSLPILVYGLSEKHLPQSVLLSKPHIYRSISRNAKMTILQFTKWVLQGVWHSMVFFFGAFLLWDGEPSLQENGQVIGRWCFGTIIFQVVVITVNLKLALHTKYWTFFFFAALLISLMAFLGFSFLYCGILWPFGTLEMYWVYMTVLASPSVWLASGVLIVAALLPDLMCILAEQNFPRASSAFFRAPGKEKNAHDLTASADQTHC